MDDPYSILGVPSTATRDEIIIAYRKRSLANHPENNPSDREATTRFVQVSRAYKQLCMPPNRQTELLKSVVSSEESELDLNMDYKIANDMFLKEMADIAYKQLGPRLKKERIIESLSKIGVPAIVAERIPAIVVRKRRTFVRKSALALLGSSVAEVLVGLLVMKLWATLFHGSYVIPGALFFIAFVSILTAVFFLMTGRYPRIR